MDLDDRTQALWDRAKAMTGDVQGDAVRAAGFKSVLDLDHQPAQVKATIAAAAVQACGTIFAALIEAEMVARLNDLQGDTHE